MDRKVTSTNDDGVNKIYMRYAEVLLMAAEIENELTGPSAAAPYLKQMRQRAFAQADWPAKVDAYVNALPAKNRCSMPSLMNRHLNSAARWNAKLP